LSGTAQVLGKTVSQIAHSRRRRSVPGCAAARLVHALDRGWRSGEHACRADRAAHQLATAVGAPASQNLEGAPLAECALEGANQRLDAIWRQVSIAALAARSQLKHDAHRTGRRRFPARTPCVERVTRQGTEDRRLDHLLLGACRRHAPVEQRNHPCHARCPLSESMYGDSSAILLASARKGDRLPT